MSASLVNQRAHLIDRAMRSVFFCCGAFSVFITVGIVAVLVTEAIPFFSNVSVFTFLTDTEWTPLFYEKRFGILPLLCGTLLTSLIAMSIALPAGITVGVYLSEFAAPGVRKVIKPILEVLAGVPTLVYGYFALFVVTPLLQSVIPELPGFNALSAGLVMGMMILPLVASLSEDAIFAVPKALKEGAYALGSSKMQTTMKVVVPAASGGIIAAVILALARAVGETMIVAIAAGQQPTLTLNPISAVETMTAYIVQVSLGDTPHGTLEFHTIFAVGLALFTITLILNSVSLMVRKRMLRGHG
jgi:phosphate transport system permease protein